MLNGKSSWTAGLLGAAALALLLAVGLAWMLWPAGSAQAQGPAGHEPADVRVVPGDRTLTVSWKATSRPGVSDDQIRHALRWSQESGVWANPPCPAGLGRNDGFCLSGGVTQYVITGLKNDVPTGVFVRSFVGSNNSERNPNSSQWVRIKGDNTTPREQQANNPPAVSAAIADATIVNESGTLSVSLTGVFADADGDSLTVTAKSSDTAKATVSVAADQSSLTVAAKSRGTATITVTANDGKGGTVEDAFTVTVKAAPVVALPLSHIPELEAGAARDVSLSGIFSDADGDALTHRATSSDDTRATVSVASDQSKLTVTGMAKGTATITVTVQDSDGNQASGAFAVAVVPAPQRQGSTPGVGNALWSATLKVDELPKGKLGCDGGCASRLVDGDGDTHNSFEHQGKTFIISSLYLNNSRSLLLRISSDKTRRSGVLPHPFYDFDIHEMAVRIGNDGDTDFHWRPFLTYDLPKSMENNWITYSLPDPGLSWTDEQEVSVGMELIASGPTGLTATPGGGKLDVSWTAPDGITATGYEVGYLQDQGWEPPLYSRHGNYPRAQHTGTDTSVTISGLTNTRKYWVLVRAKYGARVSAWSRVSATPIGPPDAPANVRTASSDRRLAVYWQAPQNNGGAAVTGYDVQYKTSAANDQAATGSDPATGWVDARHSGTDLSHWISGLTNGTTYNVRVRAVNSLGAGAWSATASAAPVSAAPPVSLAAVGIAASDGTPGIKISYGTDAQVTDVDFIVQVKLRNDSWPTRGTAHNLPSGASVSCAEPDTSGIVRCEVAGLSTLTKYSVRVHAKMGNDVGTTSTDVVKLRTWDVPQAPHNVVVTPGNEELRVTWGGTGDWGLPNPITNPEAADRTFKIRWRTAAEGSTAAGQWNDPDGVERDSPNSHIITGLDPETLYDVEVSAFNGITSVSANWTAVRARTLLSSRPTDGPGATLAFEQCCYIVRENEGDLVVSARLSQPVNTATSAQVRVLNNGFSTAWEGEDYDFTLSTKTLNFAAGATRSSFVVSLVNDDREEEIEELFLELVPADDAPYALGGHYRTRITIGDDCDGYDWCR